MIIRPKLILSVVNVIFLILIGLGAADDSNEISGAGGVSDAQCMSGLICVSKSGCGGPQCASCTGCATGGWCPSSNDCVTTSDCPTGAGCTTSGNCITKSSCTTSTNCPSSSACVTTAECTTSSACVTTSGCTTNTNCPSSNDCMTTAECTTSSDCVTTSGCTTSANCPSDGSCMTNTECTTSGECVSTSSCTTTANCQTGSDCPSGATCITGFDCPTSSTCPVGGGCNPNPQFPSSNDIITNTLCPTGIGCPTSTSCLTGTSCSSDGSCPSGVDCPTALICPTFGGCTSSVYCPTSSDCITGTNCPTGLGCVAGPECVPSCPQNITCPTCAIATQSRHAENLQRLMESSLRNIECYGYSGDSETNTAFLSKCQAMALDSSDHEEEEGYLDLADLVCRLSSKSTRVDCEGESTTRVIETYVIDDALYTCDNKEWTKQTVLNSARAIRESNKLETLTKMIAKSEMKLIERERIDGESCYKIVFVPDLQVNRGVLASQAISIGSLSPVDLPEVNLNLLAKDDDILEDDMVWTAWISAEDYVLRRVEGEVRFALTPESLHPPEELSDLRVETALKKRTTFGDFGKKKPVVLPYDAKYAKDAFA